jgi:protein-S-isoprenylcysteine O-methyltransferase Ste14
MERALALYLPICISAAGWYVNRTRTKRGHGNPVLASALLGLLWTVPSLVLLQRLNLATQWWAFRPTTGFSIFGMPVELWLGWCILWGVAPAFWLQRSGIALTAIALAAFDLIAMPLCTGTVQLTSQWITGEAAAVMFILHPILRLQHATLRGRHTRARAAMQVLTAGLIFLYFPAEMVFAMRGGSWGVLASWLPWQRQLLIQLAFVLALPGLAAVQEFATRGNGTPIPYDPPQRLVITGIYRYIANPMQLSCTLVTLLWALALRSPWMLIGPVMCLIYSAGIAAWDETADLEARFGAAWLAYRRRVHNWRPGLQPYAPVQATVYITRGCQPCSRVRLWLEQRSPTGLRIVDAETLPAGSILRMRYVCGDETVEGIRAMARALEHLQLGWALAGAAMRLPLAAPALQLLADAVGFGPREVCVMPPNEGGIARPAATAGSAARQA